jgi:hypothetical protein
MSVNRPSGELLAHIAVGQAAWTPEAVQFLRRMRRRGRSFGWIAKALGLSRDACVRCAARVGIVRARRSDPTVVRYPEPEPLGPPREILEGPVCRWIEGDLEADAWRMCGHPSSGETSWCAHHRERALVRTMGEA